MKPTQLCFYSEYLFLAKQELVVEIEMMKLTSRSGLVEHLTFLYRTWSLRFLRFLHQQKLCRRGPLHTKCHTFSRHKSLLEVKERSLKLIIWYRPPRPRQDNPKVILSSISTTSLPYGVWKLAFIFFSWSCKVTPACSSVNIVTSRAIIHNNITFTALIIVSNNKCAGCILFFNTNERIISHLRKGDQHHETVM